MTIKVILVIGGQVVKYHETWVTDRTKSDRKKAIANLVEEFKRSCRSRIEKYEYEIHIQFSSERSELPIG